MEKTEKLTFIQKLIDIQQTVKVPKSQYSEFGGYSYRSCEDILKAVKPLNVEHGLLLQLIDIPVYIEGRFYIKATAMLTDGKDTISVDGFAREEESKPKMDGSQVTGSASSYARKYALNGLYLIDDGNDADAMNDVETGNENPKEEFERFFNENVQKIAELTGSKSDVIAANILGKNGFDLLSNVTNDYYSQVFGYSKALLMKAEQKTKKSGDTKQKPQKRSARDLFGGRDK